MFNRTIHMAQSISFSFSYIVEKIFYVVPPSRFTGTDKVLAIYEINELNQIK